MQRGRTKIATSSVQPPGLFYIYMMLKGCACDVKFHIIERVRFLPTFLFHSVFI